MATRLPIKLTKTVIDRIKPGVKDEFHWDAEVKGFATRVTPKGKISFVVQGRVDGPHIPHLTQFTGFLYARARCLRGKHFGSSLWSATTN